jgi:hypothetical protein
MAVGSGAPPVYSRTLELGRRLDVVPSVNVVVREEETDETGGGGVVAEEVSISAVLVPIVLETSDVASGVASELVSEVTSELSFMEDEDEAGADDSGIVDEDVGATEADDEVGATVEEAGERTGMLDDEAGTAEESAVLLEVGAKLDDETVELLDTEA